MSRIRQLMLTAVLGVLGGAGSSFAQVTVPGPVVVNVPPPVAVTVAPAAEAQQMPVYPPNQPVAAGARVPANLDCFGGNAPATTATRHNAGFLRALTPGPGTAMPLGCSCFAADKTFLWGSCRQFFNPQRTCGGAATGYNCSTCGDGSCGVGGGYGIGHGFHGGACGAGGCGTGGCGAGGCGRGGFLSRCLNGACASYPLGVGGLGVHDTCCYGSYLNR
jgi:hypothetical protein